MNPDLSQDICYSFSESRSSDLLRAAPVPLDDELAAWAQAFGEMPTASRDQLRNRIAWKNVETLQAFAMRWALFALRRQAKNDVLTALRALTMLRGNVHNEYRDHYYAVDVVCYIAWRLAVDPVREMQPLLQLADKHMRVFLQQRLDRLLQSETLPTFGFREVTSRFGIGLIRADRSTFEPRYHLVDLALEIAELIEADRHYEQVWIQISAFGPPPTNGGALWLTTNPDPAAHPDMRHQMFHLRLVEATEAEQLREAMPRFRSARLQGSQFFASHEALYCHGWARSYVMHVASLESDSSLERFAVPIQNRLETAQPLRQGS